MNRLTLAVAGGRKTQSIVDQCVAEPESRTLLVLTFTLANQQELLERLRRDRPLAATVHVQGWFSFLMRHWVRPYLPLQFAGRRLGGLNFEGDPGWYAKGASRFLDNEGRAYRRHLAKLAIDVSNTSAGAVLDRLGRIYDAVYIDEIQDLNGYDLDVLDALMVSPIDLSMVGDLRQAVLQTNIQDPRHKQFRGLAIKNWFDGCESRGMLEIDHSATTWRSNQKIASFGDSIFADSWGFQSTVSKNEDVTGHDGLFAVATDHVADYVERFEPLCLRHSASSAKHLDLPFVTFRMAKGLGVDRVLIAPTDGQLAFLRKGTQLRDTPCCSLFVAVTRARHSVAFVVDDPGTLGLPVWVPAPEDVASQPSHAVFLRADFDVRFMPYADAFSEDRGAGALEPSMRPASGRSPQTCIWRWRIVSSASGLVVLISPNDATARTRGGR